MPTSAATVCGMGSDALHPGVDLQVHRQPVGLRPRRARRRSGGCTPSASDRCSTIVAAAVGRLFGLSTRIGASMPDSRSSTPSATSATQSPAAPPASAARATATAPCPYPSAFTTAQTAVGATASRNSRDVVARSPRDRPRPMPNVACPVMSHRSRSSSAPTVCGSRSTRSPASRPARGSARAALAVHPRRRGGRPQRIDSRRQHRHDHASQHVAGPGRGESFVATIDDSTSAVGVGHDGGRTLEQHRASEFGREPSGRGEPVVGGWRSVQQRVLAVVRGHHGRTGHGS